MSDQAVTQLSLNVQTTNHDDNKSWNYTDSLSKQGLGAGFQDFTSDESAFTNGDLASTDQGMLIISNLSNDNTLQYGSTGLEFKLQPNDWAKVFVVSGKTIYGKTTSGSVKLEKYWLAE